MGTDNHQIKDGGTDNHQIKDGGTDNHQIKDMVQATTKLKIWYRQPPN